MTPSEALPPADTPAVHSTGPRSSAGNLAREARYARYAGIDLCDLRICRAVSNSELRTVAELRAAGFGRIGAKASATHAWLDHLDYETGVVSLICHDLTGAALGTMRLQDGRCTHLELSRFVPVDSLLDQDDLPPTQFSRLSVMKCQRATDAMFALFKAGLYWCYREQLRSIVIASPPWARPIYDFMFFDSLGPRGEFAHTLAGGAPHVTMRLHVPCVERIWRKHKSPLCAQFFDTHHGDLFF